MQDDRNGTANNNHFNGRHINGVNRTRKYRPGAASAAAAAAIAPVPVTPQDAGDIDFRNSWQPIPPSHSFTSSTASPSSSPHVDCSPSSYGSIALDFSPNPSPLAEQLRGQQRNGLCAALCCCCYCRCCKDDSAINDGYHSSSWWHRCVCSFPLRECRRLLRVALPSIVAGLLSIAMGAVNLGLIGQISPKLLAGAALGNALMLISGNTFFLGLCCALDTMCTQAAGAKQHRLVGLIAQRAAIAYSMCALPILLLWYYTEELFLLARQDPHMASLAGRYVRASLPSLFPMLYSEIIKRYMTSQARIKPQIIVAFIANLIHGLVAFLLIFRWNLGLDGAGWALDIGYFTLLLGWMIYLLFISPRSTYRTCPRQLSLELFRGWPPLFKLGLPGAALFIFEWASFELCMIAAGWLGHIQLDTLVVFSNVCTIFTMVPQAIAVAASTLVGRSLGAARPRQTRQYAKGVAIIVVAFSIVEFTMVSILGDRFGRLFTSSHEVLDSFARICPLLAWFLVFDCMQSGASGILRGMGLQSFGATTNLIVYYCIGLPIGFILTFYMRGHHLGVSGLAFGLVLCVALCTIIFGTRLVRVDWKAESMEATKRIFEAEEEAEDEKPIFMNDVNGAHVIVGSDDERGEDGVQSLCTHESDSEFDDDYDDDDDDEDAEEDEVMTEKERLKRQQERREYGFY